MTGARRRGIAVLVAGCLVTVAFFALSRAREVHSVSVAAQRPELLLLTSLPLLFGEDFSLKSAGSPALRALQARYRLVPISTCSQRELARGSFLLMAQPQAQLPENLVALDHWVRSGGRLLLLADPVLEWPSRLPLDNPIRPPPTFVDTGLLAHWGLRLDAPDQRGPAERDLAGEKVLTVSPGALFGRCKISSDRLVAHCRVGSGEATVVADADFLNVTALAPGGAGNLQALLKELASAGPPRFDNHKLIHRPGETKRK